MYAATNIENTIENLNDILDTIFRFAKNRTTTKKRKRSSRDSDRFKNQSSISRDNIKSNSENEFI